MNKHKFKFVFVFLSVFTIGLASRSIAHSFPMQKINISKEQTALNIKDNYLSLFSLGHSRLFSSFLWITTLLEADLDHYKGQENSWMFYRFMSISKLEPLFYLNYFFGGTYLSIIKNDIDGADLLLSKGLHYYPNDLWLNYYAGYNAAFEIGDIAKGLSYFSKIVEHPLINKHLGFLPSLYTKMRYDKGDITLNDTFNILSKMLDQTEIKPMRARIRTNLYAIKSEVDLKCLNAGLKNCDRYDFDGNKYIFQGNSWIAQKNWQPYKLHTK